MNYRHIYHAGNHADVLKHVVLSRIIFSMTGKQKPIAVLDAHAGTGQYDLMGEKAGKTLEWQNGVAKLGPPFSSEVEYLLAPYRKALSTLNTGASTFTYPGSPKIAATLMRPEDRLLLNELHANDCETLCQNFADDKKVRVTQIDALTSVKSSLPFAERRGVILIDPPFEVPDEFQRVLNILRQGLRRMANGVFVMWYPIKDTPQTEEFLTALKLISPGNALRVELSVQEQRADGPLVGSGVVVVNPPWKLDQELALLLPHLAKRLALDETGSTQTIWLTPPS